MKKYLFQLVFFTSIIEELLLNFFNFFNFTNIYVFKENIVNNYFFNIILNFILLLLINFFISYLFIYFKNKDKKIIYFIIGILSGLFYFGLFKIFNFHLKIQFIDILCIILINIFKSYMICYSLFYKSLL